MKGSCTPPYGIIERMQRWMLWSSVGIALVLALLTGIHTGRDWERAQQSGITWDEDAASLECLEVLERNLVEWTCDNE